MTTFYLKKTNTAPRLPTNITGVGGVRISSLVEVRVCRRLQYTETVAYCEKLIDNSKGTAGAHCHGKQLSISNKN